MERKYYEINEMQARQARNMWSFTEYVAGSATEDYKQCVDTAYSYAEAVPDHAKEKALYYADMYAKKLAENINKGFRVELMCPSVMISGAGNFPTRKKEKQNEARGRLYEEYERIKGYLKKIEWLKNSKPIESTGQPNTEYDREYFKVIENAEIDRLQLLFEDKPSEGVRAVLRSNGYKWSPKNGTWQRQLTDNARASVARVERGIKSAM
ncbi:hypothetical protein [Paenibacillus sp. FSL R7-0331]|uniref:hypothetical protein n=1 Tax=Paenibacillus sp. FSL R7-0331 TaxID=1536773 RepID=UPI000694A326|nr:hypothetical protein [Paenibacillus sp. FSL R7-0331]